MVTSPNVKTLSSLYDFGATGDGASDDTAAFEAYIAYLTERGGGTVQLLDGTYGICRRLVFPQGISLTMTPGATILALPGFADEAMIQTGPDSYVEEESYSDATIHGGTIDGNRQPVTGLRIFKGVRTHVGDLLVRNCLAKGIHVGVTKGYEVNFDNVRCLVERGTEALAGSIGFHVDKATDCMISELVVIGYETSVRSDSAANDFHLVHVWSYGDNGPLKTCFHCNGYSDTYAQCYADGPVVSPGEVGYGFYVERPYQRIVASRIYCSHFSLPDTMIGVHIAPEARGGAYIANHFMSRGEGHEMLKAFDGTLDDACFVGNLYGDHIRGGKVS